MTAKWRATVEEYSKDDIKFTVNRIINILETPGVTQKEAVKIRRAIIKPLYNWTTNVHKNILTGSEMINNL